jgi:hypothetical protein
VYLYLCMEKGGWGVDMVFFVVICY